MSTWLAFLLVLAGTATALFFSGRLVRGVVGTSREFGVSACPTSVLFLGFDPENPAVGAAGSYEDVAGLALDALHRRRSAGVPAPPVPLEPRHP